MCYNQIFVQCGKQEDDTREENLKILAVAMNQLEERCIEIIKMGYFEKYSHREIAELLAYTEGFAKKKRHTCLEKLTEIYHTIKCGES